MLTGQARSPCNPPISFSLRIRKFSCFQQDPRSHSQGNSSLKFSKYLLPYRSIAINVPALVSPAIQISPNSKFHLYLQSRITYMLQPVTIRQQLSRRVRMRGGETYLHLMCGILQSRCQQAPQHPDRRFLTRRPALRKLRNVLRTVDMVLMVQWLRTSKES